MRNEELIGRKFRGFKFKDTPTVRYYYTISGYIGQELDIVNFDENNEVISSNGHAYPLEQVKKHLIPENEVIEVLNEEHGKKVIEYWKSRGVDMSGYTGNIVGYYYGVINGELTNCHPDTVTNSKAKIITLPEDKPEIKWVWVRNTEKDKWVRRIFLADLGEQFQYRYITVLKIQENSYINGDKNLIRDSFSEISYTDPNQEIEKEIKVLENQINVLKQKLCK